MSLVITVLMIVLGIGLAVLVHGIMTAPIGEEGDEGFQGDTQSAVPYPKKVKISQPRTTHLHEPGIHAA